MSELGGDGAQGLGQPAGVAHVEGSRPGQRRELGERLGRRAARTRSGRPARRTTARACEHLGGGRRAVAVAAVRQQHQRPPAARRLNRVDAPRRWRRRARSCRTRRGRFSASSCSRRSAGQRRESRRSSIRPRSASIRRRVAARRGISARQTSPPRADRPVMLKLRSTATATDSGNSPAVKVEIGWAPRPRGR